MATIIERDLRRLDLNLLLVFHVLMQERHVTRAASRLFLGQPAVSGALKRLREAFGDPLFVRGRGGMEPTPRALALAQRIEALLQGVHEALASGQPFDPATSERIFRIGASEAVGAALFPRLMRHLARVAPGVRLVTLDTDRHRAGAMLERNEVELALGVFEDGPRWQRRRSLFLWRFVCLYHPRLIEPRRPKLSLREYLSHRHLLTSFKGELEGFIDEALAVRGQRRRVVFANPHFATHPLIAREIPALVTTPDYVARLWSRDLGLAVSPLPFPTPSHEVSALWKASNDADAGLRWLIDCVADLSRDLTGPGPATVRSGMSAPARSAGRGKTPRRRAASAAQ